MLSLKLPDPGCQIRTFINGALHKLSLFSSNFLSSAVFFPDCGWLLEVHRSSDVVVEDEEDERGKEVLIAGGDCFGSQELELIAEAVATTVAGGKKGKGVWLVVSWRFGVVWRVRVG
ncbi:hypothetical protein RND71_030612 [Anisodus tanguticus]|uniref:Uncharacterized protein n=1 Tax=Anisodus tanguticus TaxID=243964 RepID=A0AAE1RFJ9_9SOLA|nr:hypothetical protein RND71_030612 [Anisodus tanguticus]